MADPRPQEPASRRGSIAVMAAGALVVLLAFGALSIDLSYVRLAQAQAQDIADAASIAALWSVRESGDTDEAERAGETLVGLNPMVGKTAQLTSVEFGDWDSDNGTFTIDEQTPNATRVRIARENSGAIPLFLGQLFGRESFDVSAEAIAASRDLHVVLVMDITNSWSRPNYYNARDAAVAFYDVLEQAHGPLDMIGMTVFTGRYAWEFTPLTLMEDAASSGAVRAQWDAMETASKAGNFNATAAKGCNVYGRSHALRDDFTSPPGGCFADMPREYLDEPGTDHTTGLHMARQMFEDNDEDGIYRAMVVLTDGRAASINTVHPRRGTPQFEDRDLAGYVEGRWREYRGPVPHSGWSIRNESINLAEDMYDELEVNTWVVSFDANDSFMDTMTQGDGYYVLTSDSSTLVEIFEEIATSLPLAVVK